MGSITAAVLLLIKFRAKDTTTDTEDSTDISSITSTSTGTTIDLSLYWTSDESLIYKRSNHEAALLANGKIIVSGGRSNSNTIIQTCEFYSSSTGWWAGSVMKNPRYYHTLTLFENNTKALATGSAQPAAQQTAEVYDSTNDTWTSTSTNMLNGRSAHGAALLKNEQILIMGGVNSLGSVLSNAELYTPSSNSFTQTNSMNIGRLLFTSTLLNDRSTVLVTGGGDTNYRMTATAELYISGSWIYTNNNMIQPRAYHSAVLLNDGNVLIAGGGNGNLISFSTAEIYNSTTRTFTPVQPMKYRRAAFTLTLLPSGKVLATGGIDWLTYTFPATCELYDPITQTWSTTQILNNGRTFHQSVLLNDSVLTIGGYTSFNIFALTCEQSATCEKYKL